MKDSNDYCRLYKYRSLASLEQRNYFRRSIQENTIYFADPSKTNDLYDCYPKAIISSVDDLRQYFIGYCWDFSESEDFNNEVIDGLVTKYTDQKFLHQYLSDKFKNESRTSIFCLSKTPTNINQWTFYADENRGVCLEYLVNKEKNNIYDITYQNHRVEIEFPRLMIDDQYALEKQIEIYTTKSTEWKIEDEVRILGLAPENNISLNDLDIKISGIIYGMNTNKDTESLVNRWLADNDVDLTPTYIVETRDTFKLQRVNDRDNALYK